MKKFLPLPLFILVFSTAVFAQNVVGQKPDGLDVTYDKFKNRTSVMFRTVEPGGVITRFGMSHSGETVTRDADDFFYVYFNGGKDCYGFCFNNPTLIFLIDGERVQLTDKGLGDSVLFQLDRELITRLSNARTVEFQVGRFEGKFSDQTLAKMKTLVQYGTVKK